MGWPVDDLRYRSDFDEPAEVHYRDPVCHVPGQAEVMSEDERRHTGLPL